MIWLYTDLVIGRLTPPSTNQPRQAGREWDRRGVQARAGPGPPSTSQPTDCSIQLLVHRSINRLTHPAVDPFIIPSIHCIADRLIN